MEKEAIKKSTLKLLNHSTIPNSVHASLTNLHTGTDICRANTKWRILTGTCTLQSVRFIYKQSPSAASTCLLCKGVDETLEHFIVDCPALANTTSNNIAIITDCIPSIYKFKPVLYTDRDVLLEFVIDCSHPIVSKYFPMSPRQIIFIKSIT